MNILEDTNPRDHSLDGQVSPYKEKFIGPQWLAKILAPTWRVSPPVLYAPVPLLSDSL
jgi:hypothetical protein